MSLFHIAMTHVVEILPRRQGPIFYLVNLAADVLAMQGAMHKNDIDLVKPR